MKSGGTPPSHCLDAVRGFTARARWRPSCSSRARIDESRTARLEQPVPRCSRSAAPPAAPQTAGTLPVRTEAVRFSSCSPH
jgi:hypothetical protein